MASIYELNGRVPVLQAVPFGLQHVLAMFVANITPIIILANVAGVNAELSAALIQNCMVIAGIGTLVQLYPVWRIGSRLPIVMGISFTFLSLAIAIATTQGMGTLVGAVIVGGLVEGCLGLFPKYWTRLIPQVVAATVVTAIGFSLLPIGANSFAGGQGAADFGSATNWVIGSVTLLTCLLTQVFARGFLRSLSVLVGLAVGYILSVCMGVVDFSGLSHVEVVALPRLMPFKPEFHLDAILASSASSSSRLQRPSATPRPFALEPSAAKWSKRRWVVRWPVMDSSAPWLAFSVAPPSPPSPRTSDWRLYPRSSTASSSPREPSS